MRISYSVSSIVFILVVSSSFLLKGCSSKSPTDSTLTESTLTSIKIKGTREFVSQTENALHMLQEHAVDAFQKAQNYIGIIEQGEHSGMWAYDNPPRFVVNDASAFYSKTWYAGIIAHDATHSELYHNYISTYGSPVPDDEWTGQGAELFCNAYQIYVLQRIGAPQHEIEYISNSDGTHCDIDGDGDCDWDDYEARDW